MEKLETRDTNNLSQDTIHIWNIFCYDFHCIQLRSKRDTTVLRKAVTKEYFEIYVHGI
jgi:hypothetical protein